MQVVYPLKKWMKLMSIHGDYTKDYFLNPLNVVNYNELKFNGEVEVLNVRNSDKSVVMVDTGENLDAYYVREF